MGTNLELQTIRRDKLFMLMEIKAENKGVEIIGLDKRIRETKAGMTQEDVAWVEKLIEELN
jgi:hypothetical protein